MQFGVAEERTNNEFNAPYSLERLNFSLARRSTAACVPTLSRERSVDVLHRSDGELLALFSDRGRLQGVQKNHADLVLEPLVVSRAENRCGRMTVHGVFDGMTMMARRGVKSRTPLEDSA